jgi:RNase adaptor protein for sRNA GlmZ degradation
METKTDKLPVSLIEKLKNLQNQGNTDVTNLGRISVDIHLYSQELERLQKMREETLQNYTKTVETLNNELKFLEEKYPKGEINLDEGTVTYIEE